MSRYDVHQPANDRKTKRTRQRSEHIEPPELTVAQPERGLPLGNRRRDEKRLPEAGKEGEHESAGDPAEVATYECEQRIYILSGGSCLRLEHDSVPISPCFVSERPCQETGRRRRQPFDSILLARRKGSIRVTPCQARRCYCRRSAPGRSPVYCAQQ